MYAVISTPLLCLLVDVCKHVNAAEAAGRVAVCCTLKAFTATAVVHIMCTCVCACVREVVCIYFARGLCVGGRNYSRRLSEKKTKHTYLDLPAGSPAFGRYSSKGHELFYSCW